MNDPHELLEVHRGARVHFTLDRLNDWIYPGRGGSHVGGFTLDVLADDGEMLTPSTPTAHRPVRLHRSGELEAERPVQERLAVLLHWGRALFSTTEMRSFPSTLALQTRQFRPRR